MASSDHHSYFEDARRPLYSLVFLLPMIVAYEIGAVWVGAGSAAGQGDLVIAYHLMQLFFSVLGASGLFLPGFLIIAILLITHVLSGKPWKVHFSTLLGMAGEAVLWTLPLFVLNRFIRYAAYSAGAGVSGFWEDIVISTGAGVYEELVFRLILVTAMMILMEDVLKVQYRSAAGWTVFIAAMLFAAHHHPPIGSEPYDFGRFAFRTMAGVYLGALFLFRGYGITAGCHAIYNILVVTFSEWSD